MRKRQAAYAAPAQNNQTMWIVLGLLALILVVIMIANNWASFRSRPYYSSGPSLHYHEGTTVTNVNSTEVNTQVTPSATDISGSACPNTSPTSSTTKDTAGEVHVNGYTRKDGTYVRPYTRRR